MAEFYAIITNFGNAPKASARLDVSVDTAGGPTDVLFNVFAATGGPLAEFTVRTNAAGLASSSAIATNDFFALSGGQPALVRARTQANATPAAATLQQSGPGNRLGVTVYPANRRADGSAFSIGKEFNIAIGDVPSPALLIANVGGGEQVVDVHRGTRGADGAGKFTNPRLAVNAIWRVDLTDADKNANIVVSSTGPVIVQLVLDDGQRVSALTCLPSV